MAENTKIKSFDETIMECINLIHVSRQQNGLPGIDIIIKINGKDAYSVSMHGDVGSVGRYNNQF